MNDQTIPIDPEVETPSGKSAGDENFPVASLMISRHLRSHVAAFYNFARTADDIADNPALTADEKIARLDRMEAGLSGDGPLKATQLADSLKTCGVADSHARNLLAAFRQDATKNRYTDWQELIGYCELSANPVGRFLMDLHGEDPALYAPSDALCTVLQIVNHLQDCQKDHGEMDRVYIPMEMLFSQRLTVSVLEGQASLPGFRLVLDEILDRCDDMLDQARARPARPRSRRLAAQMGVITRLAARLSQRLRRQDPLAGRVALSKTDFLFAALGGLPTLFFPARP